MKWIKKATNILLIVVLALSIVIVSLVPPPQQASAIGVIGSNAVKQLVFGTWEKAGIQFGSKDAKERAFEAWNMKAHEKWKADEAAGRNQDLWNDFNAISQGRVAPSKNPLDDVPGVGKVLLDWTFAGMAIAIGAEIGLGIQDARANDKMMRYMANDPPPYAGVSYNTAFGVTTQTGTRGSTYYKTFYVGDYSIWQVTSPVKDDPAIAVHISGYSRDPKTGDIVIDYSWTFRTGWGELQSSSGVSRLPPTTDIVPNIYEMIPNIDHVPNINIPQPLQDLARDDIENIPQHIPSTQPLEVIVPMDDDIWDGTLNPPYEVPDPTKPPEDGTDPDKDPDGDPNKPPGTDPDGDADKPPGTDPDGDPDAPPGTDPGKDEETPPGKDEEQPPKEDEENSCDASLKKPDFKKVGVAFTNAFPFSLPWDLKRFFDAAFAGIGSEKPSVDLTFLGNGVTVTIPDYFDSWIAVLKNIMVIMFDISLIWMFARFMQRGGGD